MWNDALETGVIAAFFARVYRWNKLKRTAGKEIHLVKNKTDSSGAAEKFKTFIYT